MKYVTGPKIATPRAGLPGLWIAAVLAILGAQGCATRDHAVSPGDDGPAREGCLACHADSDRLQALLPADGRSAGTDRALDDG